MATSAPVLKSQASAGNDERLLVVGDVAYWLQQSQRRVLQRVRDRQIPFVQLQRYGRVLFDHEEIKAWLAGAELETVQLANGGCTVRTKNIEADPARAGSDRPSPTVRGGRRSEIAP